MVLCALLQGTYRNMLRATQLANGAVVARQEALPLLGVQRAAAVHVHSVEGRPVQIQARTLNFESRVPDFKSWTASDSSSRSTRTIAPLPLLGAQSTAAVHVHSIKSRPVRQHQVQLSKMGFVSERRT
jgi:hypothetical protein